MTAKILVWDLENSQTWAKTWGPKYQANLNSTVQYSHIFMCGYTWLGSGEYHVIGQRDYKTAYKKDPTDDSRLVEAICALHEEADMVVGQNSDKFDQRVLNARMLYHGMNRLPPVPSVDTVKATRKQFKLNSYSLDDMCRFLGLGGKLEHPGIHLWDQVEEGDPLAWDLMTDYCRRDIELTEGLYLALRDGGWIDRHPNLALITGRPEICTSCGHDKLWGRGYYHAITQSYHQWQCQGCGSYSRTLTRAKEHPKPERRPI